MFSAKEKNFIFVHFFNRDLTFKRKYFNNCYFKVSDELIWPFLSIWIFFGGRERPYPLNKEVKSVMNYNWSPYYVRLVIRQERLLCAQPTQPDTKNNFSITYSKYTHDWELNYVFSSSRVTHSSIWGQKHFANRKIMKSKTNFSGSELFKSGRFNLL